jgi:hypothetical protein
MKMTRACFLFFVIFSYAYADTLTTTSPVLVNQSAATVSMDTKTPALVGGRVPVVLPTGSTLTDTELRATPVAISAASLPLPTSAATAALQTTGNTTLSTINGKLPTLDAGRIPVVLPTGGAGLTDAELRATPVPVSVSGVATAALQTTGNSSLSSILSAVTNPLAVTGTFWPVTQPVSGTFWQATQPVSIAGTVTTTTDGLTDTQLRATPVPISGTVTANAGTGTMAVSAVSLPLPSGAATSAIQTDRTQKTQITNGTVDNTIKALNVQVAGTDYGIVTNTVIHGLTTAGGGSYIDVKVNPSGALAVDASGSTLGANSGVDIGDVTINNASGASAVNVQDGGNSITVDGTVSATQSGTWDITNVSGTVSLPTGASTSALQTTGNSSLSSIDGKTPSLGQALAAASVPVVLTAAQISTLTPFSTVAATQSGTWNVNNVSGTVSLPTGASTEATLSSLNAKVTAVNTGAVVVSSSALPSGASTAAKQPALGAAGTASADVITVQGIASMTAIKTDGSATTQPVSGTVTANAGTNLNTSALALSATQTDGTQQTKITDGTNIAKVTAASTAAAAADKALVVSISPNSIASTQANRPATTALTSVSYSATSTTILAANTSRIGASIVNTSASILYLLMNSGTASSTNFTVVLYQNGYYEVPFGSTSAIKGIWASGSGGAAIVTEYTQ